MSPVPHLQAALVLPALLHTSFVGQVRDWLHLHWPFPLFSAASQNGAAEFPAHDGRDFVHWHRLLSLFVKQ